MMTALRFSLLVFMLCGLGYPFLLTGLGQWLFPEQVNGSLLRNAQGHIVGSALLGQQFSLPQYFQGRPSANGYDAANSGGSNLGTSNAKLINRVQSDTQDYRKKNAVVLVPLDAVTASGSGLDPDISVANAVAQVPRIAAARKLPEQKVQAFIYHQAEAQCDWLAHISQVCSRVNVLALNRALDAQTPPAP